MKRKAKDFREGDWLHGSEGNRARITSIDIFYLFYGEQIVVDTEFGTMYVDPEEEWEYELA